MFLCALPPNSRFILNLWCEPRCIIKKQTTSSIVKHSLNQIRSHANF